MTWRLKSVMLECEILLLAIGNEIPKIRKNSPDIVARAQLRGLIDTLADKVVEAKALIKQRRQQNRGQLRIAEGDNKWFRFFWTLIIQVSCRVFQHLIRKKCGKLLICSVYVALYPVDRLEQCRRTQNDPSCTYLRVLAFRWHGCVYTHFLYKIACTRNSGAQITNGLFSQSMLALKHFFWSLLFPGILKYCPQKGRAARVRWIRCWQPVVDRRADPRCQSGRPGARGYLVESPQNSARSRFPDKG